MELYGTNQSIECSAAYIIAKKIQISPLLNHPVFGKCIKSICTRDGEATIRRELNPKKSLINNSISALNIGDKIVSNEFYVLVKGHRPPRLSKVRFSGAHNAQEFNTDDYTFAEIRKPFGAGQKIDPILPIDYISPFNQLKRSKI